MLWPAVSRPDCDASSALSPTLRLTFDMASPARFEERSRFLVDAGDAEQRRHGLVHQTAVHVHETRDPTVLAQHGGDARSQLAAQTVEVGAGRTQALDDAA